MKFVFAAGLWTLFLLQLRPITIIVNIWKNVVICQISSSCNYYQYMNLSYLITSRKFGRREFIPKQKIILLQLFSLYELLKYK